MSKPDENTSKDTPKSNDPSWKPGGGSKSPDVTVPGTPQSPPIAKTPEEKVPPKPGASSPAAK